MMQAMKVKKLVLASSSPRRRELLEAVGLTFVVDPADIHEDMTRKLPARELVKKLAEEKAEAVAARHPDAIVLGADTVVSLGKNSWSKPESKKEARMMLGSLSGKTHEIWTGFCIIDTQKKKRTVRAVKTRVTFRALSQADIDRYIATGEYDGAGSYQLQRGGNVLTAKINGDYNNIVGLPLDAVLGELKKFEIRA